MRNSGFLTGRNRSRFFLIRIFMMLMLAMNCIVAWAEDITSAQALQQAQMFLKKHAAVHGKLSSAGKTPQLTMKEINGLYVFNVADNGGFVVVSNDDRTVPILGFSDMGNLNFEEMPSNMRAWLKGYADEIAWLKKHGMEKRNNGAVVKPQPRRVGSHPTTAVEPLVKSTWNQDKPYNDLCPEYYTGVKCATGCVATAMAQVMNYHQWPKVPTDSIPAYTDGNSVYRPALPPVTFDWDNMRDNYVTTFNTEIGTYVVQASDAEQLAVATLMKYCGWAVEMDYGLSSGSYTYYVDAALKAYFDYSATTQFVSRNFYTYAKWVDLMYNEVANQRPVVYGGTSSGGGHEFVCDGYKFENETDFFHINWGWGGECDDYFVLSALDPESQGIGGSTSKDGFHYDQDAVIGIQPSTGTGVVADIAQNVVNLTLNSMTLNSDSVIIGDTVVITVNVTNNSADDFDGTLYVGRKQIYRGEAYYSLLQGDQFVVPAGATADCVVRYKPDRLGTYEFVFCVPEPEELYSCDENVYATLAVIKDPLTIPAILDVSATPSSAVATWTGYSNNYNVRYRKAPIVFGEDFEAGLDKWTVYTNGEAPFANGWYAAINPNVWDDDSVACSRSWCKPSAYDADNWLVSPQVELRGTMSFWVLTYKNYPDNYEVRLSTTGQAIDDFNVVLQEMALAPDNDEWNKVSIDLSSFAGQMGYIAIHHRDSDKNYLMINDFIISDENCAGEWIYTTATGSSIELTGLDNDTYYECQIQAVHAGDTSKWSDVVCFKTLAVNPVPVILEAGLKADGADIAWQGFGYSYNVRYRSAATLSAPAGEWQSIAGVDTTTVTLSGLPTNNGYEYAVQSIKGGEVSAWSAADRFALITLKPAVDNSFIPENLAEYMSHITLDGYTIRKDGKWTALYLPFSVIDISASPFAGADIRILKRASLTDTILTLEFSDTPLLYINAGRPFVVRWSKADGYDSADEDTRDIKNPVFTDCIVYDNNRDFINASGDVSFKGTYAPIAIGESNDSIFCLGENNTFCYPQQGAAISACSAYFVLQSVTRVNRVVWNLGEGDAYVTSVGNPALPSPSVRPDDWFDVSGRRLQGRPTDRGVYLNKGRKVVVTSKKGL